jgi:hypothetical protein
VQITVSNWGTALHQVQYKWSAFNVADQPTVTLPYPPPIAATGPNTGGSATGLGVAGLGNSTQAQQPQTQTLHFGYLVSAGGTYWTQLQINYPVTQSTPKEAFTVTCPTSGSLTVPLPTLVPTFGPSAGAKPIGTP